MFKKNGGMLDLASASCLKTTTCPSVLLSMSASFSHPQVIICFSFFSMRKFQQMCKSPLHNCKFRFSVLNFLSKQRLSKILFVCHHSYTHFQVWEVFVAVSLIPFILNFIIFCSWLQREHIQAKKDCFIWQFGK